MAVAKTLSWVWCSRIGVITGNTLVIVWTRTLVTCVITCLTQVCIRISIEIRSTIIQTSQAGQNRVLHEKHVVAF